MRTLLLTLTLGAIAFAANAASADEQQIIAAEKSWASAVLTKDFAKLGAMLTPDLIYAHATVTWCALGDRWGALCGLIAAVGGPLVEVAIAAAGLARYADGSDALFGVAPWLPPLYFVFGVVVAMLAETPPISGSGLRILKSDNDFRVSS